MVHLSRNYKGNGIRSCSDLCMAKGFGPDLQQTPPLKASTLRGSSSKVRMQMDNLGSACPELELWIMIRILKLMDESKGSMDDEVAVCICLFITEYVHFTNPRICAHARMHAAIPLCMQVMYWAGH